MENVIIKQTKLTLNYKKTRYKNKKGKAKTINNRKNYNYDYV